MHNLPGIVPIYTAQEMRTLDRMTVEEIGIPAAVLMERAGLGAAAEIAALYPHVGDIAVLCGAGNNGGDGFVVARHLAAIGCRVRVLMVEAPSKVRREAKVFLDVLTRLEIPAERVNATAWREKLSSADLVVDAMLGTGVTGPTRASVEIAVSAVAQRGVPVVALDIPTGVDASTGQVLGTAIMADHTLTFHGPKVGLMVAPGRFHAGRVQVVDIGIPATLEAGAAHGVASEATLNALPRRTRAGSKYDSGAVVVIGGSPGMSGAISLAAQASLRAGAGITWALVPQPISTVLDAQVPEVQFRGLPVDADGRLNAQGVGIAEAVAERADAVLCGPGIGSAETTHELVRWAVGHCRKLVLDAQALEAFRGNAELLSARPNQSELVLTPHAGELARLLGIEVEDVRERRLEAAVTCSRSAHAVTLLKGEDTIVCAPDGDFIVCASHNAAATAGTGDVLAGTVAACMARGLDAFTATVCAATGCGRAAEFAAEALAPAGVIASDLLRFLPRALVAQSNGNSL